MNDDELEPTRKPRWPMLLIVLGVGGCTVAALSATSPGPATPRAPTIAWRTPVAHEDRGACTSCHRIVSREGERLPTISALSPLPHEFRGVCNNCHAVEASWVLRLLPASAMPNPAGRSTVVGRLVQRALGEGRE